jgi:hypothetical protein
MKMIRITPSIVLMMVLFTSAKLNAQTDVDGIMMGKNLFCAGVMNVNSSWNQYWEGTNLRINQNLGTVKTTMIGPMGSLGINKKLNLIFSLPYVESKASAGQLKGFKGFQDLSLIGKYRLVNQKSKHSTFSVFGIGGISTPTSNYVKDYLPLSIGLGSTNLILRGMVDYENRNLFATLSSSLITRSNVKLDRQAYYTTEMIYSNKVVMPNVMYSNFRMGYRNKELVAELVADQWTTLGGFDITKNNMPFPSNRMNQTRVGFNGKYEPLKWKGVSITSAYYRTINGRNIGKSSLFQFGFFYIFKLNKKTTSKTN